MANREVNLTKRVQTSKGRAIARSCCPPTGASSPMSLSSRPGRTHPEGAYYWNGAKAQSVSASPWARMPLTPTARRLQKEAELNAVNNGVAVLPDDAERAPVSRSRRRRLPRGNEAHKEAEDPTPRTRRR